MRSSSVWSWVKGLVALIGLIGSLLTIYIAIKDESNQDPIVLKGVFCSSGTNINNRGYIFVNDIIERLLEGHNININDKIALVGVDGRQIDSTLELTVRSITLLPDTQEGSDSCNFAVAPGVNKLLNVRTEGDANTRDEHVLEVKRVD